MRSVHVRHAGMRAPQLCAGTPVVHVGAVACAPQLWAGTPVVRGQLGRHWCWQVRASLKCVGQLHSRARGVVVSHPLRMREALGSIPSVSIRATRLYHSATAASRPPLCLNNPACCWPPHCGAQSRIASCCEKGTPGHMAKRASLEQFSSLARR